MPKPHPSLLDPARYPFGCEITTRFADMDTNRHLNNVAVGEILEDIRVRFDAAYGLAEARRSGEMWVTASVAIEYLAQGYYPDPVRGFSGVEALGRTSWTTVELIMQNDAMVAFSRSVLVNTREARGEPLPDRLREQLESALLG